MILQITGLKVDAGSGPGSRGGRIIGHTSGGKPVYDTFHNHHGSHSDFTAREHTEATVIHAKVMEKISREKRTAANRVRHEKHQESLTFHAQGAASQRAKQNPPPSGKPKTPQIQGLGESLGGKSALAGFVNKR